MTRKGMEPYARTLLGRVVSSTDVQGTRTDPTYDLAGRVVSETVTPRTRPIQPRR